MPSTNNMGSTLPEFMQTSIELDKKAKKESRELELFLLKQKKEGDVDPELLDEGIQLEQDYRNFLDREIERQKRELVGSK